MPKPASELKHANGTLVTAQEAYDAFMNTRVLIANGYDTFEVISMVWYDNNSTQADPTNVGYVKLRYISSDSGTANMGFIDVGNASLVPA